MLFSPLSAAALPPHHQAFPATLPLLIQLAQSCVALRFSRLPPPHTHLHPIPRFEGDEGFGFDGVVGNEDFTKTAVQLYSVPVSECISVLTQRFFWEALTLCVKLLPGSKKPDSLTGPEEPQFQPHPYFGSPQ